MKKLFIAMSFLFVSAIVINAADISRTIPPNYAVRTTTVEFDGEDSTYETRMENGRERDAKGFMIAPGVADSVIIMIQPSENNNETRMPVKVRAVYVGDFFAVGFKKIYRSGTTCPLDSIWVFTDN